MTVGRASRARCMALPLLLCCCVAHAGQRRLEPSQRAVPGAAVGAAPPTAMPGAAEQPDIAEMAGMNELFDDLDTDDDQNFEQQELRGMMEQLGLDTKNGRAWNWKDTLRKMDGNDDALLSKREVINHMTRVRMSKRQVADWLTHAVGLTMYAEKFLENSITGHDLPALLEDGGDHILQDELGISSLLHRKQLRRAIVARLLGDPPQRPAPLVCEPGAEHGSIVLTWEVDADEDDDDDGGGGGDDAGDHAYEGEEVTYRVRRQDPVTKEWHTVSAGSPNSAFYDANGLDASQSYSYRLDAWSISGVSEKREKRACLPKQGGQSALWGYFTLAGEIMMSMEVVGLIVAAGLTMSQLRTSPKDPAGGVGAAAAGGPALPPPLHGASSAPIEHLTRRSSAGDSFGGRIGGGGGGRSTSVDDLRSVYSGAPNGQFLPTQRTAGGSLPQGLRYEDGGGARRSGSAVNIQKDYGPFAAAKKAAAKWRKKTADTNGAKRPHELDVLR